MIVRPIHYTSQLARWRELAVALGGHIEVDDGDGWIEVSYPSGALALHHADAGSPEDGTTALRLLVETGSLDELEHDLRPGLEDLGARLERRTMGHGEELRVLAGDGVVVTFDPVLGRGLEPVLEPGTVAEPTPESGAAGAALTVEMIWYTPGVEAAAGVLAELGLTRRLSSDSGGWVDLTADGGGLAAAHASQRVGTDLTFESPSVAELHARLTRAGIEADLIDESYGLTLRVANPDAPDDVDARIWVSQWQGEYGYSRS